MVFVNCAIGDIASMADICRITEKEDIEDLTTVRCERPAEYIGDIPVYHTFTRPTTSDAFVYAGHCRTGESRNYDPAIAEREFICSPFHSEDFNDWEFYCRLASAACKRSFIDGRIPVAPHMYFTNFLDDTNNKHRQWGLAASQSLLSECDKMTVYVIDGYISAGMKAEIERAIYDFEIQPKYEYITRERAEQFISAMTEKE